MFNLQKIHLAIIQICLGVSLFGQEVNPYEIISTMQKKLEQVIDYRADLEIEVDVDFINIPVKHATVFYKKPDKIKFKTDEFIMLPKRGLGNQITKILEDPFTAIYLGQETINNELHHVIRLVPMGKNPEIIVATWWINSRDFLIARNESNTRNDGTFTVDFRYGDPLIYLPTELIFTFEIEKLNLPLKFIGKSEGMEFNKSKTNGIYSGKVYIRFSNYEINVELPDDLFEDNSVVDESF